MSLRARIRAVVRRTRPMSDSERWTSYLMDVEPGLMALPRVHRFAAAPVIAVPTLEPAPLAVWIERGDHDAVWTRDLLAELKPAPVAVLGGPLADALGRCRAAHVLLMRAGDVPAVAAIERLGQAASLAPDAHVITCDEDELDPSGRRGSPRFRPGPSPDRWLAYDASGLSMVVDRETTLAALG